MPITHRLFAVAFQQNMRALENIDRDARRAREIVRSGVADYASRCRGPRDRADSATARKEGADADGKALAANTVRGLIDKRTPVSNTLFSNDADDVSHDDRWGTYRNNPTVHVVNRVVPNLLVLASTNPPWP